MHFLSEQAFGRLKSNRLALSHFEKFKGTYFAYARAMKGLAKDFPRIDKSESQIAMVKALIMELDPDIWGLGNAALTAEQVAECFARMVVGHEAGG